MNWDRSLLEWGGGDKGRRINSGGRSLEEKADEKDTGS